MDPTTIPVEKTEGEVRATLQRDIARVWQAQHAYLPTLRRTTARERAAKLRRLREALLAHRAAIHQALYNDFGKPPEEVDLTEILQASLELKHATKHLKRWMRPRRVRTPLALIGSTSAVHYEPKGMGLILAPWNYPLLLVLGPLVGAVSAGCTAVIKPSEYAPHTAQVVKDLLSEVFPVHEVAVIEGDYRTAQALLKHPFDHIFFTGSPAVGKIVMAAAAEHLASVTLELGGKSPTLVDETADVAEAARKIAFGKFTNTGQTCIAPDHLYVHASLHDAFVARLKEEIAALYGSSEAARAQTSDYGRLIHDTHHQRLQRLLDDAVERGAHIAEGGHALPAERHLEPTVLTNVPMDSEIMHEEIFGPILPVLPFTSLDDVIHDLNSRPKPLALYLFSNSRANIEKVLRQTSAGGTCINDTLLHFMHLELPFGGVGNSGVGKAHGYRSFLAFSNERPVLRQRLKRTPLQLLYPPYSARTRKLIQWLLEYL